MNSNNSDRKHNYGGGPTAPGSDSADLLLVQYGASILNAFLPESKYHCYQIKSFCELTGGAGLDVKNEPKDDGQEMLSPFYRSLAPEKESMVTARRYIEAILDRPANTNSTGKLNGSPTVFLSSNTIEAIKNMDFKTFDIPCSWDRRCDGISVFSMAPPPPFREGEAHELRFECLQYEKTTKNHRPEHVGHMRKNNTNVELFPETMDRAIVWVASFIRNTTQIFGESFLLLPVLRDILSVMRDDPWARQELTPRQIMTLVWRIHTGIRQGMNERTLYILQRIHEDLSVRVLPNLGPIPNDVQAPMSRAVAIVRRRRNKRKGRPAVDPDLEIYAASLTEVEKDSVQLPSTKPAATTTATAENGSAAQFADPQGQSCPASLFRQAMERALVRFQASRSAYSRHQIELFCRLTGGLDKNQSPDDAYGEKDLSPFYHGLGPEKECMVTARRYIEDTLNAQILLLSSNTIESIKDMIFDTYDRSCSWDRRCDGISLFSVVPPPPSLRHDASLLRRVCVEHETTIESHLPEDAMRMARVTTNVEVFPDTMSRAADWVGSFIRTTTHVFGDGFILLPVLRDIWRAMVWQDPWTRQELTPIQVMTLVWRIHTGVRQGMAGRTLQILHSIHGDLLVQTLPDFGAIPFHIQAQIRLAAARASELSGQGDGIATNCRRRSRKRRRRRR